MGWRKGGGKGNGWDEGRDGVRLGSGIEVKLEIWGC